MSADPCIVSIEERAKAASIPMSELHGRTGMHATTWQRAKKGQVSPRLSTVRKYEAALEEIIAERRRSLKNLPELVSP